MGADTISAVANGIAACASLITLVFAVLVFVEAKKIRKLEWIEKSTVLWNNFNALLADKEARDSWHEFLSGNKTYAYTNSENWIVFSFINILSTFVAASKVNGLPVEHFSASLADQFSRLFPRHRYLLDLMKDCGYDAALIGSFEAYCESALQMIAAGKTEAEALSAMRQDTAFLQHAKSLVASGSAAKNSTN